ncbi:MAG TPA: rhomboid family intramembrane serine protease, partial [Gemmatimonadaceae bacterium]|nr:rhomboid family intramembrane serine protease [Gemmatimonadaceae bacterium]
HLIGNAVALYVLGMACEHAGGAAVMAVVYLASALAGSAASVAMGPGPSVGASGAIFGVLGAVVVLLARNRERFHVRDKRIGGVLAVWAAITLLQGWLTPMVDNAAHLGGLAAGALAALALGDRMIARLVGRASRDALA